MDAWLILVGLGIAGVVAVRLIRHLDNAKSDQEMAQYLRRKDEEVKR